MHNNKHSAVEKITTPLLTTLEVLFCVSLAIAILEQILWRGESRSFLYFPIYLFILEVIFNNLCNRKNLALKIIGVGLVVIPSAIVLSTSQYYTQARDQHLYCIALVSLSLIFPNIFQNKNRSNFISNCFILLLICLCGFSLLANLGQREYFRMANEPVGELVYADFWCILVVLCLVSYSAIQVRAKKFWPLTLTASAFIVLTTKLTTTIDWLQPLINPVAEHQYALASCFVLACWYVLKKHNYSFLNFRFEKYDQTCSAVICLIPLLFALYWQVVTYKKTPCLSDKVNYKISKDFALPLLVAEDPIYHFHNGLEFHALRMATKHWFETGSDRFGGSSISMQVAKVCYLPYDKTILRKFNQIILAYLIELQYSKDQILANYLELIPFSPNTLGLTQATQKFYNTTPKELSYEQSLTLILSIHDPNYFSPKSQTLPKIIKQRKIVTNTRVRKFRKKMLQNIENLQILETEHS